MFAPYLILAALACLASAQDNCSDGKADFVFVLDESSSVGEVNFQIAKTFVKSIAAAFTVGPGGVQIGVDTFSHEPRTQFALDAHTSPEAIAAAIDGIGYSTGGTDTAKALAFIVSDSFSQTAGMREGVPKIAVVITDGESNNKQATKEEAEKARASGIILLAVGVGPGVDGEELKNIATDPDSEFVFTAESFDGLEKIQSLIAKAACQVSQPDDVCGHAALQKVVSARILGGRPDGRCEWPWVTSVREVTSPTERQCGGVIVSRSKVITTATCAKNLTSAIEVVIGENNIYKENEPLLASLVELVVGVENIVIHPEFDPLTKANDIAVLKLNENIEYSSCALPVCLPAVVPVSECEKQVVRHQCTMAGWGAFDNSITRSKKLRVAYAKFFGVEVCDAIYNYVRNNFLPPNSACVEPVNPQNRPCSFDDGGMVVCSRNGRWVLHGLISMPSCYDRLPTIVTDITSQSVQDFINQA